MKAVRIIGIAFVITVLGALILLPSSLDVKEDRVIGVKRETVYLMVWNMQFWTGWSPWDLSDSTRLHSYIQGDTYSRIGAEDQFTTTLSQYSNGRHVIIDAKPDDYIIIDVYLDKVSIDEPVYQFRFDFEEITEVGEPGTKVTWTLISEKANFLNIQDRIRIPQLNEDFSKLFQEGLANLENFSKEQEIYLQFQRFNLMPNGMKHAIVKEIQITTDRDSIEYYFNIVGKEVFNFILENNFRLKEPPVIIYPEWDVTNNKATVQYGFIINDNQKSIVMDKLPDGLKIVDVGSPGLVSIDILPHEHPIDYYQYLFEKYLELKEVDIVGPRIERYMNNLEIKSMPTHLIMMYPIMKK
jgi:hypothetical protein